MAETVYIATQDIYVGAGVAAHRKGDVVPAENVAANGWGDSVAGPDTKAAKAAKEPADGGLAQGISDQV